MRPGTKQTQLIDRLRGRVVFAFPVGGPDDCCFEMLAGWSGRRAAGERRECAECGCLAKAVLLDDRQAGANDLLVCGASAGAIDKERGIGFRIAAVFLGKLAGNLGDPAAAAAGAGLARAAVKETERGYLAGTIPENPLVAPIAAGTFVVLEEVSAGG
jgi:hypothetical protein